MPQVIDLEKTRLLLAVKKGFQNWKRYFGEEFGMETRLCQMSRKTISFLAQGREEGSFYLYDLIMNLKRLGSGFEFDTLIPSQKIIVIDHYIFLLDRIRFEYMKRRGLLESYPGEDRTLVEMIIHFEKLGPRLQAEIPILHPSAPGYSEYSDMPIHDKEVYVRKLMSKVLEKIRGEALTPDHR